MGHMPEIASRDSANIDEAVIPALSELDRLRLQNLVVQQQLCQEQLNVLTLQFLQTAEPKALHDRVEELTRQINAVAGQMFAACKLDPQRYQLNVNEGIFVERSTNA